MTSQSILDALTWGYHLALAIGCITLIGGLVVAVWEEYYEN